jgi:hypothetical protein
LSGVEDEFMDETTSTTDSVSSDPMRVMLPWALAHAAATAALFAFVSSRGFTEPGLRIVVPVLTSPFVVSLGAVIVAAVRSDPMRVMLRWALGSTAAIAVVLGLGASAGFTETGLTLIFVAVLASPFVLALWVVVGAVCLFRLVRRLVPRRSARRA